MCKRGIFVGMTVRVSRMVVRVWRLSMIKYCIGKSQTNIFNLTVNHSNLFWVSFCLKFSYFENCISRYSLSVIFGEKIRHCYSWSKQPYFSNAVPQDENVAKTLKSFANIRHDGLLWGFSSRDQIEIWARKPLLVPDFPSYQPPTPQCLKITEKVSINIASYVYILSAQKSIKNAKNGPFWRVFENLKLAVKQCYQTGQF